MDTPWLEIPSVIIGWCYFAAWSVSFYPQVYDNFIRKSVVGLSFDFLLYNIIGHTSYLAFNCALYWNEDLIEQYKRAHPDATGSPVELNDVVFTMHAVALTLITISQCFMYERGKQRISWLARVLCSLTLLAIVVIAGLCLFGVFEWLFFFNFLGYVKLGCSFIKYCPQALMNFLRRNTVGWSIGNVLLDFTGGTLSVLQMVLDSINRGEWTAFYGNVPKVALGFLSIGFDLLFIFQHYVLFRKARIQYWKDLREKQRREKENKRRAELGLPSLEEEEEEEKQATEGLSRTPIEDEYDIDVDKSSYRDIESASVNDGYGSGSGFFSPSGNVGSGYTEFEKDDNTSTPTRYQQEAEEDMHNANTSPVMYGSEFVDEERNNVSINQRLIDSDDEDNSL